MKKRIIINYLIMIPTVLLTQLFFIEELGYWRYIGLLGYVLIGYYWDWKKGVVNYEE